MVQATIQGSVQTGDTQIRSDRLDDLSPTPAISGDNAQRVTEDIRSYVEGQLGGISNRLGDITTQAKDKANIVGSQVKDKASQVSAQVKDKASQVSNQVRDKASQVSVQMKDRAVVVDQHIKTKPYLYLLGAAGIGYLVAKMTTTRTRVIEQY